MNTFEMILAGLVVVGIVLQVLVLLRGGSRDDPGAAIEDMLLQLQQELQRHQQDTGERIERELRSQVQ
ncbi:DNA recombination protein RmuC, partial [Herbaspirillum frisingense]